MPAIAVLNLFLGWTVMGWVAALVWAYTLPDGRDKDAGVTSADGKVAHIVPKPSRRPQSVAATVEPI